jgi:uncharacterized protein
VQLEGWFVAGSSGGAGAVVAPPHPLYGGTLSNPVVAAVVSGLADAGIASLAFNNRGVGASRGRATDDPAAAREDYAAALDALADRVPGPYLAAGYSFGACAALATAARDRRVAAAVLVAPPVDLLDTADLAAFAGSLLVIVGDRDGYAPLDRLTARMSARPDVTLEVVGGADHFFGPAGPAPVAAAVVGHVSRWF